LSSDVPVAVAVVVFLHSVIPVKSNRTFSKQDFKNMKWCYKIAVEEKNIYK